MVNFVPSMNNNKNIHLHISIGDECLDSDTAANSYEMRNYFVHIIIIIIIFNGQSIEENMLNRSHGW